MFLTVLYLFVSVCLHYGIVRPNLAVTLACSADTTPVDFLNILWLSIFIFSCVSSWWLSIYFFPSFVALSINLICLSASRARRCCEAVDGTDPGSWKKIRQRLSRVGLTKCCHWLCLQFSLSQHFPITICSRRLVLRFLRQVNICEEDKEEAKEEVLVSRSDNIKAAKLLVLRTN